jgi:hypothetical protein
MSPWELFAVYAVLPMVAVMAWINKRYDTDGAGEPSFEAWCSSSRPVVFALRCAPGRANTVASDLRAALGLRRELENHRGRYPWTLYLFTLDVEADDDRGVVRGVVSKCKLRRLSQTRPEMGALVDRLAASSDHVTALWVQAELREGDDEPNANRRERGWQATIASGTPGEFAPTMGLPAWARSPRPQEA